MHARGARRRGVRRYNPGAARLGDARRVSVVRLALVGCGANAAALAQAAADSRECELAAAVDADPRAARGAARAWGGEPHAGTLRSLLDADPEGFSAVIVNTPIAAHAETASLAIAAGKHALVEAPLALAAERAAELDQQARAADVRLMAAHPLRFMPANVHVRQALDGGELGRPGMLRSHRWMPRRAAADGQRRDHGPQAPLAVREGVHDLDQACWLMGEAPAQIHAAGGAELLHVHLGFDSGAMAVCGVSTGLPPGEGYSSLTVIGSLGAAYADDHHNVQLVYRGGRPQALVADQRALSLRAQLDEFANAIQQQRDPSPSGADALAALRAAEAAQASLASGRTAHATANGYVLV